MIGKEKDNRILRNPGLFQFIQSRWNLTFIHHCDQIQIPGPVLADQRCVGKVSRRLYPSRIVLFRFCELNLMSCVATDAAFMSIDMIEDRKEWLPGFAMLPMCFRTFTDIPRVIGGLEVVILL